MSVMREKVALRRCMLSRCYNAALPILARDVLDVDPRSTALTAKDFQLYCYYGGMIHTGRAAGLDSPSWLRATLHSDWTLSGLLIYTRCIGMLMYIRRGSLGDAAGLRRYAEALVLFLYGLTAPSMVLNAITMASYQKSILVSLIHTGEGARALQPYASLFGISCNCMHDLLHLLHPDSLLDLACKHCQSIPCGASMSAGCPLKVTACAAWAGRRVPRPGHSR
jgi:hypothetical protein